MATSLGSCFRYSVTLIAPYSAMQFDERRVLVTRVRPLPWKRPWNRSGFTRQFYLGSFEYVLVFTRGVVVPSPGTDATLSTEFLERVFFGLIGARLERVSLQTQVLCFALSRLSRAVLGFRHVASDRHIVRCISLPVITPPFERSPLTLQRSVKVSTRLQNWSNRCGNRFRTN